VLRFELETGADDDEAIDVRAGPDTVEPMNTANPDVEQLTARLAEGQCTGDARTEARSRVDIAGAGSGEADRLRAVIAAAVAELTADHAPEWASDHARANGKDPIGCRVCYPRDGSWPCLSAMVADDLRAALGPQATTGPPPGTGVGGDRG
jgi:hypothetical protein